MKPTEKQKDLIREICNSFGWKIQKFKTKEEAQKFINKYYDEYEREHIHYLACCDAFEGF